MGRSLRGARATSARHNSLTALKHRTYLGDEVRYRKGFLDEGRLQSDQATLADDATGVPRHVQIVGMQPE